MKTTPLLRLTALPAMLLSLAACASIPAGTLSTPAPDQSAPATNAPAPSQPVTPSLPGLAGLNHSAPPGVRTQPFPQDIADFLLSLPAADIQVPRSALQSVLQQARGYVIEVPRIPGRPDRRISASSHPYFPYFIWVRTFESQTPGVIGYLVEVSVSCESLRDAPVDTSITAAQARCADPEVDRIASGLHVYRKAAGQPIENVTAQLLPPEHFLGGAGNLRRYEHLSGGRLFLDASRLDLVPVARWVMEADPDQGFPEDPHTFDSGNYIHAGFLLWNGDHFETRATVAAALWPCPADPSQEDPWRCPKNDRFVIAP